MPAYTLQFLGKDAHRTASQTIEAEDDYQAFDKAVQLANGHAIEVWEGKRFIATAEPLEQAETSD